MSNIYDFIAKPGVARFFQGERERDVRYLVSHYGVSEDMADESFCNGCHALLDNIHNGKLTPDNLTGSLEAYLLMCSKNQLLKQFEREKRQNDRIELTEDSGSWNEETEETFINDQGDWVDVNTEQRENDLRLMEKIVIDLPFPCEDLIWGKYHHNFSPSEMAARLGYNSGRVAITTLSRCMKKLRNRFNKERTLING